MAAKLPTSADVRKAIQARRFPPVWVWAGPEEHLKHELFDLLVGAALDPGTVAFNVDRFRGEEKPPVEDYQEEVPGTETRSREDKLVHRQRLVDRVVTAARTLPMLAERRIVLLAAGENLDRGSRDTLVEYVAAPAPECTLVVSLGLPPHESFVQRFVRAGAAVTMFWVPFEQDTKRWIGLEFKKRGKTCSPRVAAALYDACAGGEERVPLSDIALEIEKIAGGMDPGEDEVTEAHLGGVARKAHEAYLKRLSEAVGARDLAAALRALDGALLFKENAPERIVATLMYGVDRFPGGARPGSPRSLGLAALATADRRLKSTGHDRRLVLEMALAAVCGVPD